MDLPNLNALLRVNGLTSTSAPQNIADVLLRSGYAEDEIPKAIAIIQGAPPPQEKIIPAAYVQPILEHTRMTTLTEEENASIFVGRLGILQFWIGMAVAILLYSLVFLMVEVSAVPLFSIITGISLFAPPDLSTAPVHVILLFGIGAALLLLPALFFITIIAGLQIRRCHDYGLSGSSWCMAVVALFVCAYLGWHLTSLSLLAIPVALFVWVVLLSWPGTKEANVHGDPIIYSSLWGTLGGNYNETGCLKNFVKRFIAPLAYLQVGGIVLAILIHSILPRIQMYMPDSNATASSSTKNIQI